MISRLLIDLLRYNDNSTNAVRPSVFLRSVCPPADSLSPSPVLRRSLDRHRHRMPLVHDCPHRPPSSELRSKLAKRVHRETSQCSGSRTVARAGLEVHEDGSTCPIVPQRRDDGRVGRERPPSFMLPSLPKLTTTVSLLSSSETPHFSVLSPTTPGSSLATPGSLFSSSSFQLSQLISLRVQQRGQLRPGSTRRLRLPPHLVLPRKPSRRSQVPLQRRRSRLVPRRSKTRRSRDLRGPRLRALDRSNPDSSPGWTRPCR